MHLRETVNKQPVGVEVAEGSGEGKGFGFNQGQRRENWLCGKAAGMVWAYYMETG